MGKYNWQQNDWPDFKYHIDDIENQFFRLAEKIGRVTGKWQALSSDNRQETIINLMVAEAVKTSEIEGEYISRKDVFSSIRKNLGLRYGTETIKDKRAAGIAELMTDVRKTFSEPLTKDTLFHWHRLLFGNNKSIKVGAWRTHTEPLQVVSDAIGKEIIHFEAPPSSIVAKEMNRFISWFNSSNLFETKSTKHAAISSAIAHLHFETIHPFEDGNGRIGRAIAEKALSQGIGRPVLLSLSDTIEANKKEYYNALKSAQRSNEITRWMHYFVQLILDAQSRAENLIDFTLKKASFFDTYSEKLNERQKKVINRMFEEGPDGFMGGMSAKKYVNITKISKATATRDIQYLLEIGAFKQMGEAGGRSTKYQLSLL